MKQQGDCAKWNLIWHPDSGTYAPSDLLHVRPGQYPVIYKG